MYIHTCVHIYVYILYIFLYICILALEVRRSEDVKLAEQLKKKMAGCGVLYFSFTAVLVRVCLHVWEVFGVVRSLSVLCYREIPFGVLASYYRQS